MVTIMQVKATEHPIQSVTVFKSSKAEITRTFSLSLKAGQNRIEISELPSSIDCESARISGLGDARLFDVVCMIDRQSLFAPLGESEQEAVRTLEAQKQELESEKLLVEESSAVLSEYAKSLKGEHVSPRDMAEFIQSFQAQKMETINALFVLKGKTLGLDKRISKERERLAARKGKKEAKVTVVILAPTDGPLKLMLSYIVENARWEPTYDLQATTEKGKPSATVSLHYRAKITQTTGEDWNDTELILSTTCIETMIGGGVPSSHRLSFSVPPITKRKSGIVGPGTQQSLSRGRRPLSSSFDLPPAAPGQVPGTAAPPQSFGGSTTNRALTDYVSVPAPPSDHEWNFDEELPGTQLAAVSEGLAVVNKSPLSMSYTVEGMSNIPSDGEMHKVSITVLPFEADITCITLPAQNAVAYMLASVKNSSDFRLLPGPVAVFLDNSYVSKTSISDINPGDMFKCPLGVDASTRISYTRTSKASRESSTFFSEQLTTTTFTSTTKISNQHPFLISVVSKDAVPTCDDKRVKVILRKPEELVSAKESSVDLRREDGFKVKWSDAVCDKGGEKDGQFEWFGTIAAGSEAVLVTEWDIKCPASVPLVEDHEGGKVYL